MQILHFLVHRTEEDKEASPSASPLPLKFSFEVLEPFGRLLRHSPNTSTEVVGGLTVESEHYRGHDVVAMATLDGMHVWIHVVIKVSLNMHVSHFYRLQIGPSNFIIDDSIP